MSIQNFEELKKELSDKGYSDAEIYKKVFVMHMATDATRLLETAIRYEVVGEFLSGLLFMLEKKDIDIKVLSDEILKDTAEDLINKIKNASKGATK
jgi:hypothetical protein